MTLIYPDPGCYDTDGEGLEDYWSYRPGCELFPITKGKPIDPFHVNYIGMDPEKLNKKYWNRMHNLKKVTRSYLMTTPKKLQFLD